MGVLFTAEYDGVDCNQDGENSSQDRLNYDENHPSNSLSGLSNTKFLYEDQNANNGDDANNLNNNVDNVTAFALEWSLPDK